MNINKLILLVLFMLLGAWEVAKMQNGSLHSENNFSLLVEGRGGQIWYLHDVIYITCFVQLSSIISEKFWFVYLVIPAFAAYQLFGLVKGFLPHGSEGDEEDEKTRKKREKMEKRASRAKFVKTRNR